MSLSNDAFDRDGDPTISMLHRSFARSPRRARSLLISLVATIAALAAIPASAHAVMIGMESNRELVNTTQTPELQEVALNLMKAQGVQVVRANARWYEVAGGCAGESIASLGNHLNSCYDWARIDSLVKLTNERKMSVLLSFQQNPSWMFASIPNNPDSDPQYYMGTTNGQFASTVAYLTAFHKAAATRYKQGSAYGFVKFWTVHNEPNSAYYWGARPNPLRYAQLYGSVAPAIRSANPGSSIAPGPTGPTGGRSGIKPVVFIKAFQQHVVKFLPGSMSNKRRYINAVAHNPYPDSWNGPSYFKRTQHKDAISMGTIDKLVKLLDSKPITKGTKVWATEFGWQTRPEPTQWVSNGTQARYIAEAFDWLDSKKKRVQIGISYGLTDPDGLVDWQSGTIFNNGTKKPSFAMFQRMVSVIAADKRGRVSARKHPRIRVWGRSNVNPRGTQLRWRVVNGKCSARGRKNAYCPVAGQKGVPGTTGAKVATLRVKKGQRIDVVVYDTVSRSYGPTRLVTIVR